MTQWYRAYAETLNDPKVQTLSLAGFKAWHNCLYLACQVSSQDGNIGTLDDVSFAFRETKESVSSAFHELMGRGLIETVGETFHIVSWKKRQFKSDTSTSRVKKYREKMKRAGNVTVTAPDTDTDTDTDTEEPKGSKTRERAKSKDAFVLPDDIPADAWEGYAAMRKSLRKPLTDHAKRLAISKLRELEAAGYPPAAVLNQSTAASWQGLFPLKDENNGGRNNHGNGNSDGGIEPPYNPYLRSAVEWEARQADQFE